MVCVPPINGQWRPEAIDRKVVSLATVSFSLGVFQVSENYRNDIYEDLGVLIASHVLLLFMAVLSVPLLREEHQGPDILVQHGRWNVGGYADTSPY
jgi:hypothetical protein